MGSGYFGEPIKFGGNERSTSSSGGSSSSSRKGKRSNNSEKPKQPQRGLGVAQLEKIRMHSQLTTLHHNNPYSTNSISQEDIRMQTTYNSTTPSFSYSSTTSPESYGFPTQQMFMMGLNDRGNSIMYQDSQPSSTFSRWPPGNVVQESQHFAQPRMTRHYLNPQAEDFHEKRRETNMRDSRGSSNQYSETNGSQDLDLELRLSI